MAKKRVFKILGGLLIAFSSILLISSLVGIWAIWHYKKPLENKISTQIRAMDSELKEAQGALQNAQNELKRVSRIVNSAEESLETFSQQTSAAKEFLDTVRNVLDKNIKPSLDASKEKINQAQNTLDELNASIETLNNIPFIHLDLPDDDLLGYFVEITDSLENEITRVDDIADQTSLFLNDTSYLMGGDLQETKKNLKELEKVVDEYEGKLRSWRKQLANVDEIAPKWLESTSIALSIFLIWLGFSQLSLLLNGLTLWHGKNPLVILDSKRSI